MARNKVTFFYALYEGRTPVEDEYGNLTGEYEVTHGNPTEGKANISAAKGETQTRQFGENESYDKVLVMDNEAPPIDEYSVLWVDTVPSLNEDGSLVKDEEGNIVTPHDYIVKKIAKSLNSVSIAICNPTLKRYVQPDDNAPNRDELIALIGKNAYGNDWNHIYREAGLNCWIGELADETVTTIQTMPWDYKPWGCGSGKNGSCNNGWVQFEICEDGLTDPVYFEKVYREACEITAYICQMFGIDPNGTVTMNGVKVPTILCHADSHALGLGSNHGDVNHWFPKHGKSMATARADVAALLKAAEDKPSAPVETPSETNNEKTIWDFFIGKGLNAFAVGGIMGNLFAESALRPENLQNTYEKKLGLSDAEYTKAVDDGSYTNFVRDSAGYGLAQWTYWSRKQALLEYAQKVGKSIADLGMQLEFMWTELQAYTSVMKTLNAATSVQMASDAILTGYERPADQSDAVKTKRASYGQKYYDKYASPAETPSDVLYRVQVGAYSKKTNADAMQKKLKAAGFDTYMVQVDGLYKVQVGAYSKKSNADAMAAKLKASGFDTYITTKSGTAASSTPQTKSVTELAREVWAGKWGNGVERKNRLTAAGYDYDAVQKKVNELYS